MDTKQWGVSTTPVTFPISFAKPLLVTGLTFETQSANAANVDQEQVTTTGFPWERYTGTGSYTVSWIAIGKQQWGEVDNSSTNKTFPIAFSSKSYSLVVTGIGEWSNDWYKQVVTIVSATQFTATYGGDDCVPNKIHFIALGG